MNAVVDAEHSAAHSNPDLVKYGSTLLLRRPQRSSTTSVFVGWMPLIRLTILNFQIPAGSGQFLGPVNLNTEQAKTILKQSYHPTKQLNNDVALQNPFCNGINILFRQHQMNIYDDITLESVFCNRIAHLILDSAVRSINK